MATSDIIHDQIPYSTAEDRLIFRLSDTPEFQRLARISQMGLARMVYPGAKHCRDEHSRGVEYNIRAIIDRVIRPQLGAKFDPARALCARIAGLLHDIGHGPGSHAFEDAMHLIGRDKSHEDWTRELIFGDTRLNVVLREIDPSLPRAVADFLEERDYTDIFSSLVSGQMDCDRLDFVLRDCFHTRVSSSFTTRERERLINALRIEPLDPPREAGERARTQVLALLAPGLSAAEGFLRAYQDLYVKASFHKLKRGAEAVQAALLHHIAILIRDGMPLAQVGLPVDNPIIRFMRLETPSLGDYLRMDDASLTTLWDAAKYSNDYLLRDLGSRLLERRLYEGREIGDLLGGESSRARLLFEQKRDEIADQCGLVPGVTLIIDVPNKKGYREYPPGNPAATRNIYVCPGPEDESGKGRAIVPLSRASPEVAAMRFPDFVRLYAPDSRQVDSALAVVRDLVKRDVA